MPSIYHSVQSLKKLAKQIKKTNAGNDAITHMESLNMAAQEAGYENFNHARKHLPKSEWVKIACHPLWHEAPYRNSVGHLTVEVTTTDPSVAKVLDRIIFTIPEFFIPSSLDGIPYEHFRIDSGYYHRVVSEGNRIESNRASRYVISFHLLNGRWQAGIFDYGTKLTREEMLSEIVEAVRVTITETIKQYMAGAEKKPKLISVEEYEQAVSLSGWNEQEHNAMFARKRAEKAKH